MRGKLQKPYECPQCNGTGYDTADVYLLAKIVQIREGQPNCKVCAGTGLVVAYQESNASQQQRTLDFSYGARMIARIYGTATWKPYADDAIGVQG